MLPERFSELPSESLIGPQAGAAHSAAMAAKATNAAELVREVRERSEVRESCMPGAFARAVPSRERTIYREIPGDGGQRARASTKNGGELRKPSRACASAFARLARRAVRRRGSTARFDGAVRRGSTRGATRATGQHVTDAIDEAEALHARVRAAIAVDGDPDPLDDAAYDELARAIAEFQARHLDGYARLVAGRGI